MTDEGRERMTRARKGATSSAKPRDSWPTPNTPSGGNLSSTPKHEGGIDLEGAVELWATPSSHERTHDPREVDHGIQLANQAVEELWQIPQVDSFRSRGGDRKDEMGLDQQARLQWVTPASRDYKGANSELHVTETGGGQKAHGPTEQPGRALFHAGRVANADSRYAEQYEGIVAGPREASFARAHAGPQGPGSLFPPRPADRERWAEIIEERPDLAPAVEYEVRGVAARLAAGMDFARADQLRGLGNMVVPQQGALAFLILLGRSET